MCRTMKSDVLNSVMSPLQLIYSLRFRLVYCPQQRSGYDCFTHSTLSGRKILNEGRTKANDAASR